VNDVEVGVNGSSLICLIDSCNGAVGGIGCPKCLCPEKKVRKAEKFVLIWSKNVSRSKVFVGWRNPLG
jgi:hypothetical protein